MKCLTEVGKMKDGVIKTVVRVYSVSLASILTDKYGYGKAKVHQIVKSMLDRADSINKGYIKIDDLEKTLEEEYDIVFK